MTPELIDKKSSRWAMFYSTSIIGSASILSVVVGLVRIKVAAILLGPIGIGMIGLLQSIVASVSTMAGMGVTNSGTRYVAQSLSDQKQLSTVRAALFWGTFFLAGVGGFFVWSFREQIAVNILGESGYSLKMGWIALGVVLSVGTGSQTALIRGMHRPRDIALVTVFGAVLGTLFACTSILGLGENGVFLFVVSAPLATFLVGHWFARKLPKVERHVGIKYVCSDFFKIIRLGFVLMLAGLGVVLGHLWLRTEISQELGVTQLGYFQAAWMISSTYIGFVLTAMGNDYYPRIAARINDSRCINQMVNQQTEIALLLGAPILLGMFLFSPVAVIILYSPEFLPAAELVRLFVFGDLIKMTAFPQRYVVMSSGRGIYFLFVETLPICLLLLVVMMFKGAHGLYAVGWGYVGMNVLILVMSAVFVKVKYGFVWDGFALRIFYLTLILLLCSFFVVNIDNKLLFLGFSMLIMLISVVFNIRRLLFLCAENQPKISIFNAVDRIYFLLKKQFSVFR